MHTGSLYTDVDVFLSEVGVLVGVYVTLVVFCFYLVIFSKALIRKSMAARARALIILISA